MYYGEIHYYYECDPGNIFRMHKRHNCGKPIYRRKCPEGKAIIDRQEVFILDVRTNEEYAAGHINGSTLLAVQDIPEKELGEKLKEIPKDKKILVYCRSGSRSAKASRILAENGFAMVYNMQGGITEWMNAGYEVEK